MAHRIRLKVLGMLLSAATNVHYLSGSDQVTAVVKVFKLQAVITFMLYEQAAKLFDTQELAGKLDRSLTEHVDTHSQAGCQVV